jgi:uncharacterized membrane protein YkvA (DUF1232 family)
MVWRGENPGIIGKCPHPTMSFIETSRQWARRIKRDALTLWFARSHPDTPWHAKALALVVLAYALSPIDLIPDFIPVLGYLDDVLLLPALIWLAVRLLPPHVLAQARERAQDWMDRQGARPRSRVGAVLIVAVWVGLGAALLVCGLGRWG